MSILAELRRRKVFRVAGAYVVAAWLIVQVVSDVSAPLNLPEWFEAAVIVLLVIGFPIAVLIAWAFELTPEGLKVTAPDPDAATRSEWHWADSALAVALLAIAAAMIWSRLTTGPDVADVPASPVPAERSIAVLPFADMSPEGDQAYFGDGIAEELLDELTRLEGLRVASRTSSFCFRDGGADSRDIAEALNVSTILEGSVRKSGNRLRITAQLIDAEDGYHLWSDTYEREMTDIFEIQDDIAAAVAGSLGVSLGVGDVNAFRGAGTSNVEAYDAYLQATKSLTRNTDSVRLLERAVQLDPDYGAALAALGVSIASTMWDHPPEEAPAILDRAIPKLLRAVEVDPDSAYAQMLLATVNYARFDWNRSEDYYSRALDIQRDGEILANYGNMHTRSGRSSSAMRLYAAAEAADRASVNISFFAFVALLALGEYESIERRMADSGAASSPYLAYFVALNKGDPDDVRRAIEDLWSADSTLRRQFPRLPDDLDSPEAVLSSLEAVHADESVVWPSKYHDIALLAAYFGDPEFALDVISKEMKLTAIRWGTLWCPVMSEVRKLPGFKELVTDVNLVEYWRTHGWSDHCRPLGIDDFECF